MGEGGPAIGGADSSRGLQPNQPALGRRPVICRGDVVDRIFPKAALGDFPPDLANDQYW